MSPIVMQVHKTNFRRTMEALFGRTQLSLMGKLILFDSDFGTILQDRISASAHGRKKFVMPVPTHQFQICNFAVQHLGHNYEEISSACLLNMLHSIIKHLKMVYISFRETWISIFQQNCEKCNLREKTETDFAKKTASCVKSCSFLESI